MTIAVGDPAPDFSLVSTENNEPASLSDYKGKNVVLAFFPAVFSGVCDTEMCTFRDAMADYNNLDAQVIGISTDPPHAQREFVAKHGLEFPILTDLHHEAIKAYGLEFENFAGIDGFTVAHRAVVVIGKDGKVTWTWLADSPGNEPPYDQVESAVKALG